MTEEELKKLHHREIHDEREKYDIHYLKDGYEYLGLLWEAYGDRYFYRNLETQEVVSIYYSIGD